MEGEGDIGGSGDQEVDIRISVYQAVEIRAG
jgi:hypothetical protein